MQNYRKTSHTTFDCKYHKVLIIKYRKPVLIGLVAERVGELIQGICKEHEVEIIKGHVSKDHIVYSNDGSHTFQLPYSKMLIRIPTAQFMMKMSNFTYDPKGICPDTELLKDADDFKNGYDRELNVLFERMKR